VPELPTGTLTLLFTDIERSTRLLQQVGERYADILQECRRLLRTAFGQWHGQEVDTQGDAFFVVFARATDAVCAAVDIQRALAAHSWPQDAIVRVRIGLHTGEPQRSAEGYVGLDVHYAARIMSAGHGGQTTSSCRTWASIALRTCGDPAASFNSSWQVFPLSFPRYTPWRAIPTTCLSSRRRSLDASGKWPRSAACSRASRCAC